jgi:RHS repeat-associated protein
VLKYNPLNRLTNMVDAVGTSGFEYFAGGLLASENGPWSSDTVTNGYANRLRCGLGLQQPTDWWTNGFKYDLARRMTNVASPAGTFSYTFGGPSGFASSLIQKISLPGGGSITNDFDAIARMKGTWLKKSDGTTLDASTYGLNAGNQRTWHTNAAGAYVGYNYDSIGQLKVADSSANAEDRGYQYDASWNLNYRTNNGSLQTFSVDSENQLTSAPDGSCTYDANGNLIVAQDETQLLGYDAENQLVVVTNYSGEVLSSRVNFYYDGMNRLRKRLEYDWVPDTEEERPGGGGNGPSAGKGGGGSWNLLSETRYLYDGWRVIQERDGDNTPTVSYTRGTDLSGSLEGAGGIGGLLARSHDYSSGTWSTHNYYHADGNGNITALVDSSGASQASYRYDPYGNTLSSSGSLAGANAYRFSSKEWMATAGLYYYGYRCYSPNWQRWVNRDPLDEFGFETLRRRRPHLLGENRNSYEFLRNEPNTGIDPFGLTVWVCARKDDDDTVGNHTYFYDDSANSVNGKCQTCGVGKHSGACGKNNQEDGPWGGDECSPIPGSKGSTGDALMNCCKARRDKGAYFPFLNDCHSVIDDCLSQNGYQPPSNPRTGKPKVGPIKKK